MARARVLLADDNDEFLSVTTHLLEPEFDVVATVGNGQAAVDEVGRLKPDVLVLDISMPVLNGIETARRLSTAGVQTKIVFLTVHEDLDYVRTARVAGATGYVFKSRLVVDLPMALREVMAGRFFVSSFGPACLER